MITVSEKQALERWDTLPDDLREVLVADETSFFIHQISELQKLSEEKEDIVSLMTGRVLMGFLHPGDMGAEIQEAAGIDLKVANGLTHEISQKIFVPLQKHIDEAYRPVSEVFSAVGTAPKMLSEMQDIVPVSASRVAPPALPLGVPVPVASFQQLPPVPPPPPLSGVMSKNPPIRIADPLRNLQKTEEGKIILNRPSVSPFAQPPAAVGLPSSSPSPLVPMAPAPLPVMLDGGTQVPKNITQKPDFHLSSDDKMAALRPLGDGPKLTQKPAVLEFGSMPKTVVPGAPAPKPPRVVNYSEPAIPSAPKEGRSVMEMTAAPVPNPPAPPLVQPPVAPKPSEGASSGGPVIPTPPPKPLI